MVLEGGVAGGVELQWSVVSGQWLETSAAGVAWFWRGALRGVSPRTREGRRPDRHKRAQPLGAAGVCRPQP